MNISFLSAHTVSLELKANNLAIFDVQNFLLMSDGHVVQRSTKRLPPIALTFKNFLLIDGAAYIEEFVSSPITPRTRKHAALRQSSSVCYFISKRRQMRHNEQIIR